MASDSKKTCFRRRRKVSKMGRVRKAANRNKGTTMTREELFGS